MIRLVTIFEQLVIEVRFRLQSYAKKKQSRKKVINEWDII
jgi:hypothetical protein